MRKPAEITHSVIVQASRMWHEGLLMPEIHKLLGLTVTVGALRRAVTVAGHRKGGQSGVRKFSPDQVAEWKRLRAEGQGWKQIARYTDFTDQQIRQAVYRYSKASGL